MVTVGIFEDAIRTTERGESGTKGKNEGVIGGDVEADTQRIEQDGVLLSQMRTCK